MKLIQKSIDKNLHNLNSKTLFVLLCAICLTISSAQGQTKGKKPAADVNKTSLCKIGTTVFECPKNFTKEPEIDENTQLFKQNYECSITYFFVAIPKNDFDDINVRNAIAEKLSGKSSDKVHWKSIDKPFVMNLETAYEKKIINRLGYDDKLINFISRYFEFNGKTIVLGYGYKTGRDGMPQVFEKIETVGDNAIGCNAIATTLNSITKEKKGNLQYCNLSMTVSE